MLRQLEGKMKKCPDCKIELTKDDIVDSTFTDAKGDGIGYEQPIYECPKCGCQWDRDELD